MISTIKSADRSPLHCDRSVEDPRSPLPQHVAAEHSLPRHLLVSLAGITAEVTSLQQRCVDTPQLHASLATILGRLDGLVDSIYQHAADPGAPNVHGAAGLAVGSPSEARADAPVDVADATNLTRSPTRVDHALPGHSS